METCFILAKAIGQGQKIMISMYNENDIDQNENIFSQVKRHHSSTVTVTDHQEVEDYKKKLHTAVDFRNWFHWRLFVM